ncbi:Fc receptor-like protein 5 [Clarias gariepinus]|uniref:Fc receptor-like protein 5 n=1 Tax=Clarias gariepinus TaxID=13013 RepID=UPI00234D8A0D|nr:Fc receptor-like protein 5 [Clarias gariepinus]
MPIYHLAETCVVRWVYRDRNVILEGPVHPVTEGHHLTLRCLDRNTNPSILRVDFYKDGSVLQTQTTGEMIIHKVSKSDEGFYHCKHFGRGESEKSWVSIRERPRPVLSVSPQSWVTEGDSVTLNCEITNSSTNWTFSWYRRVTYRDNTDQISYKDQVMSHSTRGSRGSYSLSSAAFKDTGVYVCRGEKGEPTLHTQYSNLQPLWITGESPPVSLIINPNRTQHFTGHSLSLSCEDQRHSTGWTVRQYTHSGVVTDCPGSVTGSTCKISYPLLVHTGVYWCKSESGENSNPVNITVYDGNVILESPVHPVTEGHPLTLRCLGRNTKPSILRVDFSKDGSVLQTPTTGEMIIHKVSKSDEGFYYCKHFGRGESEKSWVSVRREKSALFKVLHETPRPVLSVSTQSWVTEGDSVTESGKNSNPANVTVDGSSSSAPSSVLMLICSVVTPVPYLLVTIILLIKCYRARAQTDERRSENAVVEE